MNATNDSHGSNHAASATAYLPPTRALTSPLTLKQGLIAFAVLAVIGVFYHPHAPLAVGTFFGFYAWFGLLACAALVVLAKMVFGMLLKRAEDYYGQ